MLPPVGLAPNHDDARVLTVVCQISWLLPVLVIVTTCPGGLGIPCVVLKFRFKGVAPMIGALGGGGGCTINCTTTDCVLCAAKKAILLVYVPGFKPVVFTPTAVTVLVAPFHCPLAGVTVSHEPVKPPFKLIFPEKLPFTP